jgi:hypothetical protein
MAEDVKGSDEQQKKADAGTEQAKTYDENYVKELIAERDKAKDKARKFEEQRKKEEEQKAIDEGRLKEVLAQRESELADAKKKADLFEQQQIKLREQLINKLPEDEREFASDINDLDKLSKYVEKRTTETTTGALVTGKQRKEAGKPEFKNADDIYNYMQKQGRLV